jgi:hypothetical protein
MGNESRKQKSLTVSEVREMAPLADVYELSLYSRYMVAVPKSVLVGGNEIAMNRGRQIAAAFKQIGIPVVIMVGVDLKEVTFLELKEEKL